MQPTSDVNFSFCLQSIPAATVYPYLIRNYHWNSFERENCPVFLFVRYFKGESPDSYHYLQMEYPANCCFEKDTSELGSRLVIVGSFLRLSKILDFASSLPCQILFRELEAEFSQSHSSIFKIRDQIWKTDQPKIMGILNITPDSFYDGGKHFDLSDYAALAEKMIQSGADIIDIGGESTRPGSQSVDTVEEIRRVLPAITQIRNRFDIPISIDTVKPDVAEAGLEIGADMINDVSGLSTEIEMINVVNKFKASYCLMHTQGNPENMQHNPQYFDSIGEIYQFFKEKLEICSNAGLDTDRILLDPGIGFGKTVVHNQEILRFLNAFSNLNTLILLGTSNKSFISQLLKNQLDERLPASIATQVIGWTLGASVFRVHQIKENRDAVRISWMQTNDPETF